MKKIRINAFNKLRGERLINGASVRYSDLSFFNWTDSPQGRNYWNDKYMKAYRKGSGVEKADLWNKILTEEDYAYFRVLMRKGFRKDTFLSSPAQREYVKFADELQFDGPTTLGKELKLE